MIENGKVSFNAFSLSFTLCEIDESNTKYIDTILQAFKTACRPPLPPSPPLPSQFLLSNSTVPSPNGVIIGDS